MDIISQSARVLQATTFQRIQEPIEVDLFILSLLIFSCEKILSDILNEGDSIG